MSRSINIKTVTSSYEINIGNEFLNSEHMKKFAENKEVLLVCDPKIGRSKIEDVLDELKRCEPSNLKKLEITCSEETKNFSSVEKIHDALINSSFSRDCLLIGLGGGILTDITGFAASTYQRGVNFLLIPTTLLSQVDASVGGKTAVNHKLAKNMIGAFHQPIEVIISVDFLDSLPDREIRSGLVEMIKHGLILDQTYFNWLEKTSNKILNLDKETLIEAIAKSVEIKAKIVSEDEKERGKRALLNFGHTFGHGIEVLGNYKAYNHGEAVALGIICALRLSESHYDLNKDILRRTKELYESYGIEAKPKKAINPSDLLSFMQLDKKKSGNELAFILLQDIGKANKVSGLSNKEVEKSILEAF